MPTADELKNVVCVQGNIADWAGELERLLAEMKRRPRGLVKIEYRGHASVVFNCDALRDIVAADASAMREYSGTEPRRPTLADLCLWYRYARRQLWSARQLDMPDFLAAAERELQEVKRAWRERRKYHASVTARV